MEAVVSPVLPPFSSSPSSAFSAPAAAAQAPPAYLTVDGAAFAGRVERASAMPPVFTVRGFLSPDECALLIESGRANLRRSIVVDGKAGKSPAPSRTSESCYLHKESTAWLAERIEQLLPGKGAPTHEPPQVARYLSGQYYLPHFDAFDMATGPGRECAMTGGQRLATVLVYLNDVAEGGATYFPKLDLRVRPELGKALVFFPCSLDGTLDTQALHTAENATDETWVCRVWVREHEFK